MFFSRTTVFLVFLAITCNYFPPFLGVKSAHAKIHLYYYLGVNPSAPWVPTFVMSCHLPPRVLGQRAADGFLVRRLLETWTNSSVKEWKIRKKLRKSANLQDSKEKKTSHKLRFDSTLKPLTYQWRVSYVGWIFWGEGDSNPLKPSEDCLGTSTAPHKHQSRCLSFVSWNTTNGWTTTILAEWLIGSWTQEPDNHSARTAVVQPFVYKITFCKKHIVQYINIGLCSLFNYVMTPLRFNRSGETVGFCLPLVSKMKP